MDNNQLTSLCFSGLNQLYFHPQNQNLQSLTVYFFSQLSTSLADQISTTKENFEKEKFLSAFKKFSETDLNSSNSDKSLNFNEIENLLINALSTFLKPYCENDIINIRNSIVELPLFKEAQLLHYIGDVI
jgi:hypothetical protein